MPSFVIWLDLEFIAFAIILPRFACLGRSEYLPCIDISFLVLLNIMVTDNIPTIHILVIYFVMFVM
jgi:hypothetical protein